MTSAQQRRLYFPAWTAAAKNHGWLKPGGARLLPSRARFFDTPDLYDLVQRICTIAAERAAAGASTSPLAPRPSPLPDHFRHACHIVAFGEDISSSQLTNAQLDRILALFRLLADPDDLGATLAFYNPAESSRKRLLWWLHHNCREAYIVQVSRERFGTDDWESLEYPDLRQLHMTLKNRPAAHKPTTVEPTTVGRGSRRAASAASQTVNVARETEPENCPF